MMAWRGSPGSDLILAQQQRVLEGRISPAARSPRPERSVAALDRAPDRHESLGMRGLPVLEDGARTRTRTGEGLGMGQEATR